MKESIGSSACFKTRSLAAEFFIITPEALNDLRANGRYTEKEWGREQRK